MSFLARLFGRNQKSLTEVPAGFRWPESRTGMQVSALSALEVSTVMACVRAIAEGVAQVPMYVHGRDDRGVRGPRVAHRVLDVITRRPNDWQSGFEFREQLLVHLALVGNAFVYVSRNTAGEVLELIPIEPGKVFVTRERDMSLTYRVTFEDGRAPVIPPENMWHIRGPSWNTWMGLDAVKVAREAIGLAMATEASHAEFHRNSARPSGMISVDGKLTDDQYKRLQKYVADNVSGVSNTGRVMIVDQNGKFMPFAMTGVDAQHLETRKFQVFEICRHFRIQPMIIGATETPTFNSAEQLRIMHVVDGLTPWAERIEQSASRVLFGENDRFELRHDFNGLMRGAAKDRAEFYTKALGAGGHGAAWMTPNEVRGEEGLDPVDGGDEIPKPPEPAAPVAEPAPPADTPKSATFADLIEAVKAMPPPVVNTPVTVEAPQVKAGDVKVDVHMPKRGRVEKTVSAYDEQGRIVGMTETEVDDEQEQRH